MSDKRKNQWNDVFDTFNWYSNRFHLLLKKEESFYDDTI